MTKFVKMKYLVLFWCLSGVLAVQSHKVEDVQRSSVQEKTGIFGSFPKDIYNSFSDTAGQQRGHITTFITFLFTSIGWLLSAQIYSLMMAGTVPHGREEDTMDLGNVFGQIMTPETAVGEIGGGLVVTTFTMLIWLIIILIFRDNEKGSREKKESVHEVKPIEYAAFDLVSFIDEFPNHLSQIFSWKSVGQTIGFNLWGMMTMQLFWFLASFLPKNAMRKKREISSDNQFDKTSYSPYNKEMVNEVFKNLYEVNSKYAEEDILWTPLHRRKHLKAH